MKEPYTSSLLASSPSIALRSAAASTRRSRRPEAVKERGENGLLGVDAIAETYWHIHQQPRTAWAQEINLRPYKEAF